MAESYYKNPTKTWRGQGCWGLGGAGREGGLSSTVPSVLAAHGADLPRPGSPEGEVLVHHSALQN